MTKPGITYAEITNKIARELYNIDNVKYNFGPNENNNNTISRETRNQLMDINIVKTGDNNINRTNEKVYNSSMENNEKYLTQNTEENLTQRRELIKVNPRNSLTPVGETTDGNLEGILSSFMGQIKTFIESQLNQVKEEVRQNSQRIEFLYLQLNEGINNG